MRQAIVTRYAGPTDHRGSRVVVKSQAGRKVYPWAHEHDVEENHRIAARQYAKQMKWWGPRVRMYGGALPDGTGYAFVLVEPGTEGTGQ